MHRDRRRYRRQSIPIPVHIYSGARWLTATALDISQDGIRLRLEEEILLSKRLGLRIVKRNETIGLRVCWSSGYEAGCAFLETLDEQRYAKLVMDAVSA